MKINVSNKQKNLRIQALDIKKIVKAVIALENQRCDEVSIHFVTTKTLCKMHEIYFNDPTKTDCISFPMDDRDDKIEGLDYRILGEVFVCPQTAIDYAHQHQSDPYRECILYVVHGLLHLMGYDDLEPALKAKMRKTENRHMKNLEKLNFLTPSQKQIL
ncbi:MAG: rRNA maturation RNase YbeY [Chlamydiales bacterium 38-26]|nr:rRNA maturation RNase YbeY [Chlamydiales bacterium]OJV08372.1 MAG: rRNA maturation RNase YbeY [Chlamydiales bacterium 38-26]